MSTEDLERCMDALDNVMSEVREYEAALREVQFKAQEVKQDVLKVLVDHRMFHCLNINIAMVNRELKGKAFKR